LSSETVLTGATLAGRLGRFREAAALFERAIAVDPASTEAHFGRAMALILDGQDSAADEALEASRRTLPDNLPLAHLQARFLATCPDNSIRDGARALGLAKDIHQQLPSPEHAETVAMALAAEGRFDEATAWQTQVVEDLESSESTAALEVATSRLELYRSGRPAPSPWSAPGSGS
jgi:tetratricopeptide (TPR) repeat protein